jgi:glyoxylase-like metal-dependent hydrolase (beta-lactamase superfamily II)
MATKYNGNGDKAEIKIGVLDKYIRIGRIAPQRTRRSKRDAENNRRRGRRVKIVENIWQVGGGDLSGPGDAASYLVRFGDRAALIDAGCGDGHHAVLNNINACLPESVDVDTLFLTHCHYDHTGGAARLQQDLGCRIAAHELDAVFLENGDSEVTAASWYGAAMQPLTVDLKLKERKTTIAIGDGEVTAIHWPGHSPGSIVLTTCIEDKLVLFGQDVHGPIHPALLSDELAYQDSLQMLLNLQADLLLEGHFGIFQGKGEVREFIQSFIR